MIELFRDAPLVMTIAVLLAAVVGAGIAYRQSKPKLDAANKQLQELRDEFRRRK